MPLEFLAKPNGYPAHIIAGVEILKEGRRVVVDPALDQLLVDEPGKPLRLSSRGYEHFRSEFGKALVCEPIGAPDGEAAAQRISALEVDLGVANARIAELEQQLAAKPKK